MAKPVPSLPAHWEEFFLCLVFHMMLPLLPIGIELWQAGMVSAKSLTLGAAMYVISIGGSSRSRLMFAAAVGFSMLLSALFGLLAGQVIAEAGAGRFAAGAVMVVFVVHMMERYNRHVVEQKPYWSF